MKAKWSEKAYTDLKKLPSFPFWDNIKLTHLVIYSYTMKNIYILAKHRLNMLNTTKKYRMRSQGLF